ncbi:SPFH domain-containing protein [Dethiosulfatarculus sandiegensis]|uniref:Band 7 domain-containing protein n=1 Tax=Dethiosulfatarculus sandiegensis TaxID=1429043 RepID=A0A0D2JB37_9BACT|nr:SPFH domain-containing protein [Dethiosulfatarculus sandiegensis]KIX15339.1 hypothetical protein X474_04260 [Dethiosulfatarculus sandiegensis]
MPVSPIFIILLFLVIFIIFLAVMGFKVVQQAETMVIERLGRYNRTLDSGINIIWPIIEKPRRIHWRFVNAGPEGKQISLTKETIKIDLRETVYDFPSQNAITKDNVGLQIDALLYFQVLDPVRAVYEVANLPEAMEKLTKTTLRNVVGELDLDECLASRDTINNRLTSILDEASDKWGVKVTRVELQDLSPPEDVRQAMEKQMRAERDRRAAILEAEGKKQAAILEAQGRKEAAITTAEGEAEARIKKAKAEAEAVVKVTDAVKGSGGDPINYLIAVRYVEALTQMVSGKDNKVVYIPYEATGVLGSLGGIKDLFQVKQN